LSSESPRILGLFQHARDLQSFSSGQPIFQVGEDGSVMYVVKEGQVDIVVGGAVVDTVGPGGIVGEMALIDRGPRSASAIARTDCKLAPVDEARFHFLVQQTPFFAMEVMRIVVDRLRRMNVKRRESGE
jgi:CRP-like cAMP-binding protein